MTLTLSTKGQLVLPAAVRAKLGLKAGARLECRSEDGRIVLTPPKPAGRYRYHRSKRTGSLVVTPPPEVPVLTSERVRELLADFP